MMTRRARLPAGPERVTQRRTYLINPRLDPAGRHRDETTIETPPGQASVIRHSATGSRVVVIPFTVVEGTAGVKVEKGDWCGTETLGIVSAEHGGVNPSGGGAGHRSAAVVAGLAHGRDLRMGGLPMS
jgi:hypothetical protein